MNKVYLVYESAPNCMIDIEPELLGVCVNLKAVANLINSHNGNISIETIYNVFKNCEDNLSSFSIRDFDHDLVYYFHIHDLLD